MRTGLQRGRWGRSSGIAAPGGPWLAAGLVVAVVVGLWALGVLDLSRLGFSRGPSREGLVAVPVSAQSIPAYTRLTRDHVWDAQHQRVAVVYLRPEAITDDMLTQVSQIFGRVLDRDKAAGFVFTTRDLAPEGTRPGLVGGIPAGKRALRVEADRVDGLFGLRAGDRFDLVATVPIEAGPGDKAMQSFGGVHAPQLALQAQLLNWQKQATVRVLVQNGVVVQPMTTRQVPVFSRTLTQGGVTRTRPVQEVVLAVDPGEVAPLTEAIAVGATVMSVPRSGRSDDDPRSVTPESRPWSPFATPGLAGGAALRPGTAASGAAPGSGPVTMVETIKGGRRELTAVPVR